ncbi:Nuclease-related domain family [gamma proteobacterium HTCC5015]|nr:Nuclease-related domain family [gamma proteobacterium HTCC5015]
MTVVYGQIETLRKIKEELSANNVSRFKSIADIKTFQKNYNNELSDVEGLVVQRYKEELKSLSETLSRKKEIHEEKRAKESASLTREINQKEDALNELKLALMGRTFKKIFLYPKKLYLEKRVSALKEGFHKTVEKRVKRSGAQVELAFDKFDDFSKNKESIIKERINSASEVLGKTKDLIDSLYPLIAGAIGENSVVNTLKTLPDNYYLINDFSVSFSPPIYNRKNGARIFSIQIDHLLISPSGLYVVETKNWSRRSVENHDLRSPVEQVLRASYALFVHLNEQVIDQIGLDKHHWGDKKIPIRNLIVMTNHMPKEEFQYVKILPLHRLSGYIQYFEKSLSDDDTRRIFEFLTHQ